MKLGDYLSLSGESFADFSKKLGVTSMTLYRWARNKSVPRRSQMAAIYKITNGAVTPGDFYDLHEDGSLERASSGES